MKTLIFWGLLVLPTLGFSQTEYSDYLNRGRNKLDFTDYKGAIEDFSKAIDLNPEEPLPYFLRARCKEEVEDFKGALWDYSQAIDLDGNNMAYLSRAKIYFKIKEYQKAIDDFNYLIGQEADNADYYLWRGRANNKKGFYKEALKDYNFSIEYGNKSEEIYGERALTRMALEDYSQAIEDLRKTDINNNLMYAIAYAESLVKGMKTRPDALSAMTTLYDLKENFPDCAEIYFNLALWSIRMGESTKNDSKPFSGLEGTEHLTKAIELEPDSAKYYYYRGYCLKEFGLDELGYEEFLANNRVHYAWADLTKAIELDNDYNEARYHRLLLVKLYNDGLPDPKLSVLAQNLKPYFTAAFEDTEYFISHRYPAAAYGYWTRAYILDIHSIGNAKFFEKSGFEDYKKQAYEDYKMALSWGIKDDRADFYIERYEKKNGIR